MTEILQRSLGEWLDERAGACGDRPAVEVDGIPRSYGELGDRAARLGSGIAALGLQRGAHVCVMMTNSVAAIEVWFALARAGIVEIPMNIACGELLLRYYLEQSDASAVVCDERYLPQVRRICAELPAVRHIVVHGSSSDGDVVGLSELYAQEPLPRPDVAPASLASILYTSGTTGPPKGVMVSHRALLHLARRTVALMDYTPQDRLYTAFPLFHINAKCTSVLAAMEAGASLIMESRFSVSRFWDTCRSKGVTVFNYLGALLTMLYKQPPDPRDADNPVRAAFGAPCPVEIWDDVERRFGLRLTEIYGMTEVCNTTVNPAARQWKGSGGKESDAFCVRVVDEDDNLLPAGEIGEIVVRPKQPGIMFDGYYKMPEETLHRFRNLWFHTGDRGQFDDAGYLYFVDRTDDVIRRRGENISSWEIERAVTAHPDVVEAAVYGVASELSEQEVMVAVVVQPGKRLQPFELIEFCHGRVTEFAVPRYVRFMDGLPKNTSERVEKYKLRASGVTDDTWQRAR